MARGVSIPRERGSFAHPGPCGAALDNADMASPRWSVDRLREEIELLGARGLPRDEYFAELAPRLRRVIDNDASCWHTLDPHTRLMTSDAPAELVERGIFTAETAATAGELLVRSEYLVQDSNTFAELAARRVSGRDTRAGHPRTPRAQRPLPRPARAGGHPARAACGVRHPRAGLGCGPHRAARTERRVHAAGRRCASLASRARSPTAFGHRCASTLPDAARAPKRRD